MGDGADDVPRKKLIQLEGHKKKIKNTKAGKSDTGSEK